MAKKQFLDESGLLAFFNGIKGLIPQLEAGDNIDLTPDATNPNKITISADSSDFTGATDTDNGESGSVPAPDIADKDKFLKGDGTWSDVPEAGKIDEVQLNGVALAINNKAVNIELSNATTTDDGLMSKEDKTKLDGIVDPMSFKGSLGTSGTITALPSADSSNKGFVYKVITDGTYSGQDAKVGDTFISDGTTWILIPSGDETDGTVTSVAMTVPTGLSVSGSPITSSGSLDVVFENGYSIPTDAKQTEWDAKQDTIVFNTVYDATTNKAATMADIPTQVEYVEGDNVTFTPDPSDPNKIVVSSDDAPQYVGATDTSDGISGMVPVATSADKDKVLAGSGQWVEMAASGKIDEIKVNGTALEIDNKSVDIEVVEVLLFNDVIPVWSDDTTYEDFPYKGTIITTGVTADYIPEVAFALEEASSGNYASIAESDNGKVYVWSKKDTSISIPTVYCIKK